MPDVLAPLLSLCAPTASELSVPRYKEKRQYSTQKVERKVRLSTKDNLIRDNDLYHAQHNDNDNGGKWKLNLHSDKRKVESLCARHARGNGFRPAVNCSFAGSCRRRGLRS